MTTQTVETATWGDLFRGRNGLLALALVGGVALHAINVHIVTTVLPSVVQDIGGLQWYAWSTTLFVVASIIGASLSVWLLALAGQRGACVSALLVFSLGSLGCALAPSMPWMLAARTVQGLGGGVLAALCYALIRLVFEPALWPRAVALVSGMWGVATLCGPALGGLFAQAGHWRWAFWALLPVALFQALLVTSQLRPANRQDDKPSVRIPFAQITLLALSVLAVAAGSLSAHLVWQTLGIVSGVVLGMAAIIQDRRATVRMLPLGATTLTSPLGAVYASLALLLIGTTTEIFVPYFLQMLHGMTPLTAGYMTAAMAGGWSLSSMLSSGQFGVAASRLLRAGPALSALSLVALAILMPALDSLPAELRTLLCAIALAGVGAGVGICWPHLVTRVMTLAPMGEGDRASAAITTVQLYGMALGAAGAGLVTNIAGLNENDGIPGTQSAAIWLFASFAVAPLLVAILARRFTRPAPQHSTTGDAVSERS